MPPTTIIHIPIQFRTKLCAIAASTSTDMIEGSLRGALLEEGRSKLLLSPVPKGGSIRTELSRRISLWHSGDFGALLTRVEEQYREREALRKRSRKIASSASRIARAKRLVRDGAYGKAVNNLSSEVADLVRDQ